MKPEQQPKGTLVILIIYLVILAVSWVSMYLLMLNRGG